MPEPMAMPFGQALAAAGNPHADQRFGVGAHAMAEVIADGRERAFLLEPEEQVHAFPARKPRTPRRGR